MPKKIQLQLIGTESEDRLDKKICPWDAIKMYEFEEGLEVSEFFYRQVRRSNRSTVCMSSMPGKRTARGEAVGELYE